jgi:hypothetical protein
MKDYTQIAPNQPPAAVVSVQLLSSVGHKTDCHSILDTGSSITFVPEYILEEIEAQVTGADVIMDVTGKLTLVPLYDVQITFMDFQRLNLPPIPVAGLTDGLTIKGSKIAIAGRDILNQFKLTLDGPNQQFDVQ